MKHRGRLGRVGNLHGEIKSLQDVVAVFRVTHELLGKRASFLVVGRHEVGVVTVVFLLALRGAHGADIPVSHDILLVPELVGVVVRHDTQWIRVTLPLPSLFNTRDTRSVQAGLCLTCTPAYFRLMPFQGTIRSIYVKATLVCVLDSILGDAKWEQKLSDVFVDIESIGYSKWRMYRDIKILLRSSGVVTLRTQDMILCKLLRQMNAA
jgi:hypothetical protein